VDAQEALRRVVAREAEGWAPQPGPQAALVACPVHEVFYGGARGGGKTDGMLGIWLNHERRYRQYARGIFFRREYKELEEVLTRSTEIFPHFGARWKDAKAAWLFPSGATLKFRHLWDAKDAQKYQGHQYTLACFEELTQWPSPAPIDMIRATLRSAHGVPVLFRATGNPGGPGHNWVKARYVSPAPLGYKTLLDPKTCLGRVYIPARLRDNPVLTNAQPTYEKQLYGVGSETLVRAWLSGDWDIVAGGFFDDVFSAETHILRPFPLPRTWRLRRSFDWGSAKPASLGIWAEADGSEVPGQKQHFPRGSLIRVAELYTVAQDARTGLIKANEGLRLDNRTLGRKLAEISLKVAEGRLYSGCVADPSIWIEAGGKSIYQQLQEGAREAKHNLLFSKADNYRVPGWQKLREMLQAARATRPEHPGLWVFESCTEWLRTVPVLPRDPRDGDDVDTAAEDHAADETRYAVMSLRREARQRELA
jgi:hypothetical protein